MSKFEVAHAVEALGGSLLDKSQFLELLKSELSIDLSADDIARTQGRAVLADKKQSLFLVAGPGTEKTTAIGL